MPRRHPAETRRQVIELAHAGTRVAQLAATFGISKATIYNWLRQDRIDRGEAPGTSTDTALELAAAKKRTRIREPTRRAAMLIPGFCGRVCVAGWLLGRFTSMRAPPR